MVNHACAQHTGRTPPGGRRFHPRAINPSQKLIAPLVCPDGRERRRNSARRGSIMKKTALALGLLVSLGGSPGFTAEGRIPTGIPHLDHVFVIMMENHGYGQIIHNPNAPFINTMAHTANLATNYFAIAHPSLTNYLEAVGGSNFGVHSDNYPDWHSTTCVTNL